MNAARLHQLSGGPTLVYEDAPVPEAREGEVLVRVHAAAVTPTELQWSPTSITRTGEPRPLPLIMGHEFSGVIGARGPGVFDETARRRPGHRDRGSLRVVVGAVFPLAEARRAYAHKPEGGKTGADDRELTWGPLDRAGAIVMQRVLQPPFSLWGGDRGRGESACAESGPRKRRGRS